MDFFMWVIDFRAQWHLIEPGGARRVKGCAEKELKGYEHRAQADEKIMRTEEAVLDAPPRNATGRSIEVEVAQRMDPTCAQNPWAITAVLLLCTAVSTVINLVVGFEAIFSQKRVRSIGLIRSNK